MSLVYFAAGAVVGFFVGIAASLLYLRWKLKRQLGVMQNQMQDMMDLTEGMGESMPVEEVEEVEEKEE